MGSSCEGPTRGFLQDDTRPRSERIHVKTLNTQSESHVGRREHTRALTHIYTCTYTPGAMLAPLSGARCSGPRRAPGSRWTLPKHTLPSHLPPRTDARHRETRALESMKSPSSRRRGHFSWFTTKSFCWKTIKRKGLNTFHLVPSGSETLTLQ